ncbi:hypothetical protein TSOC_014537, partial [Tetrabaena socialis]
AVLKWPADHPDLDTVYTQVYRVFVEAIDAVDNGVGQYEVPPVCKPCQLRAASLLPFASRGPYKLLTYYYYLTPYDL